MMCGKRIRKAAVVLSLAALLAGLFGCGKPKTPQHSISEVTSVSIGCGHMDFSYSYSFRLHKEGEQWLFDTECAVFNHMEFITLENQPVEDSAVEKVLAMLEQNGAILYAETYKPPKKPIFEVLDATTYSFCLKFSDGSLYAASDFGPAGNELEGYFYALSEQMARKGEQDHG